MPLSIIQTIAVWIVPVLLAITLHEVAHGWMANRLGDNTAKVLGRITLNPLKHIDLIGTILVPLLIAILSNFQFVFGWAKPVPINWGQLRNPRRDMAFVAAAGPLSNLIMAILWAACLKIGILLKPETSNVALFMALTGQAGITINLVLAFLNLLIIPPLDGSRILASFLKPKLAMNYLRLDNYGFLILILLMTTGVLGKLIYPPIIWTLNGIYSLFNITH
jgi:Zn-dependent protease